MEITTKKQEKLTNLNGALLKKNQYLLYEKFRLY